MTFRQESPTPHSSMPGWLSSSPAAIFCALTGCALVPPLEACGLLAPIVPWLLHLLLASAVARWVLREAHRARREVSYDFATFCFWSWPVFAPIYVFRTRGWRAFAVLGWFALIYFVSGVTASVLMRLLRHG